MNAECTMRWIGLSILFFQLNGNPFALAAQDKTAQLMEELGRDPSKIEDILVASNVLLPPNYSIWSNDAESAWFGVPPMTSQEVAAYFPGSAKVCAIEFQDLIHGRVLRRKVFHWNKGAPRQSDTLGSIETFDFDQNGIPLPRLSKTVFSTSAYYAVPWFTPESYAVMTGSIGTEFAITRAVSFSYFPSASALGEIRQFDDASFPSGSRTIFEKFKGQNGRVLSDSWTNARTGQITYTHDYSYSEKGDMIESRGDQFDDGVVDFYHFHSYEDHELGRRTELDQNFTDGQSDQHLTYQSIKEIQLVEGGGVRIYKKNTSWLPHSPDHRRDFVFHVSFDGVNGSISKVEIEADGAVSYQWVVQTRPSVDLCP